MRLIDADALKAYIEDYACRPCKEYYLDRDGVRCNFCSFQFCLDGIDQYSVQRTGKSNDLISRQAAIDICLQYCPDDDGTCSKNGNDLRNMLDEIEALPTMGAVRVVRCGECKWWKCADESEIIRYGDCTRPSSAIRKNWFPDETWFCADGEGKDDAEA